MLCGNPLIYFGGGMLRCCDYVWLQCYTTDQRFPSKVYFLYLISHGKTHWCFPILHCNLVLVALLDPSGLFLIASMSDSLAATLEQGNHIEVHFFFKSHNKKSRDKMIADFINFMNLCIHTSIMSSLRVLPC